VQLNPKYLIEYFVVVPTIVLAVYATLVVPFLIRKPKWYKWWGATAGTITTGILVVLSWILAGALLYAPLWAELGHMPSDAQVYAVTDKYITDRYADIFLAAIYSIPATIVSNIAIIAVAVWRKRGIDV